MISLSKGRMVHSAGCNARWRHTHVCTCFLDRPMAREDEKTLDEVISKIDTKCGDCQPGGRCMCLHEWREPVSNEDNEVIFEREAPTVETPRPRLWNHMMIDIETMSTHPTNALVLSCALLPFDPTEERLAIGEPFHWRFELMPQLLAGRQVDVKTQEFWAAQPTEAQRKLLEGQLVSIPTFHAGLCSALAGAEYVWANGIVFDIGNIVTLLRENGFTEPWAYNAVADARTIYRHTPQLRTCDLNEHGFCAEIIPHDPVSDCIKQAHGIWEHWPARQTVVHHSV